MIVVAERVDYVDLAKISWRLQIVSEIVSETFCKKRGGSGIRWD
jgi:hypothetical protein